jgi:hypothetical protein
VLARLRQLPLPVLAVSTVVLAATALALVFFYAPIDADQGLSQKIFYIHVPIALLTSERNQVDPHGDLWLSVLESTAQPVSMG